MIISENNLKVYKLSLGLIMLRTAKFVFLYALLFLFLRELATTNAELALIVIGTIWSGVVIFITTREILAPTTLTLNSRDMSLIFRNRFGKERSYSANELN